MLPFDLCLINACLLIRGFLVICKRPPLLHPGNNGFSEYSCQTLEGNVWRSSMLVKIGEAEGGKEESGRQGTYSNSYDRSKPCFSGRFWLLPSTIPFLVVHSSSPKTCTEYRAKLGLPVPVEVRISLSEVLS